MTGNAWTPTGKIDYTKQFDEYKEAVSRLFPALPKDYVDAWSISKVDALALGHFLECYPRKVVVLDVGTFVGVSAFHLASQPKVLRVTSVGPNPTITDEIEDKSDILDTDIDLGPLQSLRTLDVARAALAEFGDEQRKIQLRVGTVGSNQGGSFNNPERVEVPMLEPSEDASFVAFVDGLHTKGGVQADLEAIFEYNPRAVAILDDCRYAWGPSVQAGIVSFMEKAQEKYHFQLFGDLSPSVATSNLGIVYPDTDAAEVKQTLVEFSELFSERLDLLRLLCREEELINAVNSHRNEIGRLRTEADRSRTRQESLEASHRNEIGRLRTEADRSRTRQESLEASNSRLEERNSQLKNRNSRLKEHKSQLITRYSSRRYKLADTLSERVLQVPGIRKLVRRKPQQ